MQGGDKVPPEIEQPPHQPQQASAPARHRGRNPGGGTRRIGEGRGDFIVVLPKGEA